MSCSGVDDPRSTELTPSFLRHHAGKKEHWSGSQSTYDYFFLFSLFFSFFGHTHSMQKFHRIKATPQP